MPNWIDKFTNLDQKLEVEPFQEKTKNNKKSKVNNTTETVKINDLNINDSEQSIEIINFNGSAIVGKSSINVIKKGFALRLDSRISLKIESLNLNVSKNDAINALIDFALDELKSQNKTLIIK